MLRAHSVAQQEAFDEDPSVEGKEWRHLGSYRNQPRENHVAMDGAIVPKDDTFTLYGADGFMYYPMYPRDTSLPPGESINCHCICQPVVNKDILGLSLEERQALQQQAIDEMDDKWEKELDARIRAERGIDVPEEPHVSIDVSGRSEYNVSRSKEELLDVARRLDQNLDAYADNESKWNGTITISATLPEDVMGQKAWNCSISLRDTADDEVIVHELLHARSASYYGKKIYAENSWIEEGSVQFLTEQICKKAGIEFSEAYEEQVQALKEINAKMNFGTDLEFAKEIYNIPLEERFEKLYEKVFQEMLDREASTNDVMNMGYILKKLEG